MISTTQSMEKSQRTSVIVSCHNFHNTPSAEGIGNIVARTQATGADIAKIATTALDITDCASIFQITIRSEVIVQVPLDFSFTYSVNL